MSGRPKLIFFGDPHGDFEPVIGEVERQRPEAIILLGDLQPRRPLHVELASIRAKTEIFLIHGNHDTDTDSDFDNLWGSELADRNLHGRVATVAGCRVAGLGGIFRGKIWDPARPVEEAAFQSADIMRRSMRPEALWRDAISRRHRSSIFPEDIQRLSSSGSADILVTHEAPSAHPHGWRVLDELANALGARLLVHGHHHENIDYVAQGLMNANAPFRAFGVDKGSHLVWPSQGNELP